MADQRQKNQNWCVAHKDTGKLYENQIGWASFAQLAVLMDIRDELQTLNRIFGCVNFQRIPRVLDTIAKNTTKKRPKLRVVKRRAA